MQTPQGKSQVKGHLAGGESQRLAKVRLPGLAAGLYPLTTWPPPNANLIEGERELKAAPCLLVSVFSRLKTYQAVTQEARGSSTTNSLPSSPLLIQPFCLRPSFPSRFLVGIVCATIQMMHSCNCSVLEAEGRGCCGFEASLPYKTRMSQRKKKLTLPTITILVLLKSLPNSTLSVRSWFIINVSVLLKMSEYILQ